MLKGAHQVDSEVLLSGQADPVSGGTTPAAAIASGDNRGTPRGTATLRTLSLGLSTLWFCLPTLGLWTPEDSVQVAEREPGPALLSCWETKVRKSKHITREPCRAEVLICSDKSSTMRGRNTINSYLYSLFKPDLEWSKLRLCHSCCPEPYWDSQSPKMYWPQP